MMDVKKVYCTIEYIAKKLSIEVNHSTLRTSISEKNFSQNTLKDFIENLSGVFVTSGIRINNKQIPPKDIEKSLQYGLPILFPILKGNQVECFVLQKDSKGSFQIISFSEEGEKIILVPTLNNFLLEMEIREPLVTILVPEPLSPLQSIEHTHPETKFEILARLLSFIQLDKKDVWVIIIYGMAAGLLNLIVPISTASLINTVAMETLILPLVVLTFSLLIFLGLSGFMKVMQTIATEVIQKRMMVRLSFEFLYKISGADHYKAEDVYFPELSNKIFEISSLQKGIELLLLDGLASFLTIVIGLVVIAFYHSFFLIFSIFILILLYLILFIPLKSGYETGIKQSKQKYKIAHWIQEVAHKPGLFSSSFQTGKDILDDLNRDYLSYRDKYFSVLLQHIIGLHILKAVGSAIVLGLGGYLVIKNQLTLGQLVAAELIIMTVIGEFSKLGKYIEVTYDMLVSIDKIAHVVDLPMKSQSTHLPPNPEESIGVNFTDVTSSQKSGGTLNFHWKQNEKYLLTLDPEMENSPIFNLILNPSSITSGQILFNEVPVQTISQSYIESKVCLLRKIEIFEGSILDNLSCGRKVPIDRINEVLKKLDLLEEINHLPEGIYTVLNPVGQPLSTRQLRLLVVARTVISEPKLVFVDGFLDLLRERDIERILALFLNSSFTLVINTNHPNILKRGVNLQSSSIYEFYEFGR